MSTPTLAPLVDTYKALGHPARLRILAMLRGGELCVCQLNAVIGVAASTISAHLAALREAGLVAERKAGRWVHYRLASEGAAEATLATLWLVLQKDPQIADDGRVLERVTALPVEAICRPDFDAAALREVCCPTATEKRKTCA